mmetsp:Transcript_46845/g.123850  ORF Transcript_46845/g.123850 Transcript_46845/m.123850 type:complete len:356 (+) Transcript_46845:336-1403(+)
MISAAASVVPCSMSSIPLAAAVSSIKQVCMWCWAPARSPLFKQVEVQQKCNSPRAPCALSAATRSDWASLKVSMASRSALSPCSNRAGPAGTVRRIVSAGVKASNWPSKPFALARATRASPRPCLGKAAPVWERNRDAGSRTTFRAISTASAAIRCALAEVCWPTSSPLTYVWAYSRATRDRLIPISTSRRAPVADWSWTIASWATSRSWTPAAQHPAFPRASALLTTWRSHRLTGTLAATHCATPWRSPRSTGRTMRVTPPYSITGARPQRRASVAACAGSFQIRSSSSNCVTMAATRIHNTLKDATWPLNLRVPSKSSTVFRAAASTIPIPSSTKSVSSSLWKRVATASTRPR